MATSLRVCLEHMPLTSLRIKILVVCYASKIVSVEMPQVFELGKKRKVGGIVGLTGEDVRYTGPATTKRANASGLRQRSLSERVERRPYADHSKTNPAAFFECQTRQGRGHRDRLLQGERLNVRVQDKSDHSPYAVKCVDCRRSLRVKTHWLAIR
jgi:hypothetical protein